MKLGKREATHDGRDLLLSTYLDTAKLPTPPKGSFGHDQAPKTLGEPWQMLGNDAYGDCVWAGAAHETMLWAAEAGRRVPFTDQAVLSDYSAVTGFDPNDPNTDQGTDVRQALGYRRSTGIADAASQRHRIGAYVKLDPGNPRELWLALYLFGAVAVGIQFPGSAMTQFDQGKPWAPVRGATIEGGHYIPVVARLRTTMPICVTWGQEQEMTLGFYEKYNDETFAVLSPEMLSGGKSLEGFDLAQLQADLQAVKGAA
jgi:hypothetical protein